MRNKPSIFDLPRQIQELWSAQQALKERYSKTGLKFTLDGRLVGDIAEAIAFEKFDLEWPKKRTKGVDLILKSSKKTVQVKASGLPNGGPSFSPGEKDEADFLLFFQIDFKNGKASVIYNGPEHQIRKHLPATFKSTKTVKLATVKAEAEKVPLGEGLPVVKSAE